MVRKDFPIDQVGMNYVISFGFSNCGMAASHGVRHKCPGHYDAPGCQQYGTDVNVCNCPCHGELHDPSQKGFAEYWQKQYSL